ncbi:MAG: carboxypeptidase regulatory-like domain-containing protein [Candidatus Sumerlaeia bacterium]
MGKRKSGIGLIIALALVATAVVLLNLPEDFGKPKLPDIEPTPTVTPSPSPTVKLTPTPSPTPIAEEGEPEIDEELVAFDNASTVPLWGVAIPRPLSGNYNFVYVIDGEAYEVPNEEGEDNEAEHYFQIPLEEDASEPYPRELPSGRLAFLYSGELKQPAIFMPLYGDHYWDCRIMVPINESARKNQETMKADPDLHALTGRVIDNGGMGVARSKIIALDGKVRPLGLARTNVDGQFTMALLPPKSEVLYGRAPGYQASDATDITLDGDKPTTSVTIVLEKAIPLMGRVTNENGDAIPQTEIFLWKRTWGRSAELERNATAISDAKGYYMADNLGPAKYDVTAMHDDYSPFFEKGLEITIEEPTKTLDIVMRRGFMLKGRVVREYQGTDIGVEDAEIEINVRDGKAPAETEELVSGPDGHFEIANLPYEKRIVVGAKKDLFDTKAPALSVKPGDTVEPIVIRFPEAGKITGYTVDKDENPIAGAEIAIKGGQSISGRWGSRRNRTSGDVKASSDTSGYFVLDDIPLNKAYDLEASASGYATTQAKRVLPNAMEDLTIEMQPAATIAGRVVDRDTGDPVKGMPLRIYGEINRQQNIPNATTDEDGAFAFKELQPDTYNLTQQRNSPVEGFNHVLEPVDKIDLLAGKSKDDLVLEAFEGISLNGRVLLMETDEAVQGANISASFWMQPRGQRRAMNPGHVKSDAEGKFTIEGLFPGVWRVSANKRNFLNPVSPEAIYNQGFQPSEDEESTDQKYASILLEIKEDRQSEEIILYLGKGGTVRGQVFDQDNMAVEGVQVQADTTGGSNILARNMGFQAYYTRTKTDAEGRFEMQGLPKNDAELLVKVTGGAPAAESETFRLSHENPEAEVNIYLPKPATLSGRVLNSDKEGISGANLYVRNQDGSSQENRQVKSDENGAFSADDLGGGKYYIYVRHEDYENKTIRDIEVGKGEDRQDFQIVLDSKEPEGETVEFSGVVTNLKMERLGGWLLHLRSRSEDGKRGYNYNTQTAHDGSFRFDKVVAGDNYTIRLSSRGGYTYTNYETGEFGIPRDEGIIVVPMGGVVTGRVISVDTDDPIGDAKFKIDHLQQAGNDEELEGLDCRLQYFTMNRFLPVSENGEFEMDDLPLGSLRLHLESSSAFQDNPVSFMMDTSLQADLGDVYMLGAFSAEGKLVDKETGEALVQTTGNHFNLRIRALWGDQGKGKNINSFEGPDIDGIIKITGLPFNTHTLELKSQKHLTLEIPIEAPRRGETVDLGEIEMDSGITLRGKALSPDGKPAINANIQVRQKDDSYRSGATNSKGEFAIPGFAPGPARLTARAYNHYNDWVPQGKQAEIKDMEIEVKEDEEIEIVFPPFEDEEEGNDGNQP